MTANEARQLTQQARTEPNSIAAWVEAIDARIREIASWGGCVLRNPLWLAGRPEEPI